MRRQRPVALQQRLHRTASEAEVPRLIAMGHSSVDAAASLAITVRTIQKHLEHFYRACCSRRSC